MAKFIKKAALATPEKVVWKREEGSNIREAEVDFPGVGSYYLKLDPWEKHEVLWYLNFNPHDTSAFKKWGLIEEGKTDTIDVARRDAEEALHYHMRSVKNKKSNL